MLIAHNIVFVRLFVCLCVMFVCWCVCVSVYLLVCLCVCLYVSHTVVTTLHVNAQCLVLAEISQPTFSVAYSAVLVPPPVIDSLFNL